MATLIEKQAKDTNVQFTKMTTNTKNIDLVHNLKTEVQAAPR